MRILALRIIYFKTILFSMYLLIVEVIGALVTAMSAIPKNDQILMIENELGKHRSELGVLFEVRRYRNINK